MVKSIVARDCSLQQYINFDGPRVRFSADALSPMSSGHLSFCRFEALAAGAFALFLTEYLLLGFAGVISETVSSTWIQILAEHLEA
jgi:hypothetical protein